jgi:hypothetical protein
MSAVEIAPEILLLLMKNMLKHGREKKKLSTFSRMTAIKLKTLDVEPIHPTIKVQMLKKHQGARYHPTTWLVVTLPKVSSSSILNVCRR